MIRLSAVLLPVLAWANLALAGGPAHFPRAPDTDCFNGRAELYDECGDQFAILASATQEAAATGKTVMVVYGAEWCIWCHVFTKYLAGETGRFSYNLEGDTFTMFELAVKRDEASELRAFASKSFVIAHIESNKSPNGADVLRALGAADQVGKGIPVILTVKDGAVARVLQWGDDMEVRRDATLLPYRGFDRPTLLEELKRLATAAGQES